MNGIEKLLDVIQKKEKKIIGMMSGTSADGVDLVVTSIKGCGKLTKCAIEESEHFDYPPHLRNEILDAMKPSALMRDVCSLDFALGDFFGDCVKIFVNSKRFEVDLVSSHGQTVYHNPPGHNSHACTLQIGDGDIIALRSGIITISDFRIKDISSGGEGAPLVPHADYILYARADESIALNNLGGISNVTYIPKGAKENEIMAFDTGPANALIDAVAKKYFNISYDEDGDISARGKVNFTLFEMLKSKEMDYVSKIPPKSTGKEVYNEDYLPNIDIDPLDMARTVVEFTAWSIYESYKIHVIPYGLDRIVLTGGGAMNKTLVKTIKNYFDKIPVEIASDWQWRESKAFALLANELMCGNAGNNPKVTGAKYPVLLGKISLP